MIHPHPHPHRYHHRSPSLHCWTQYGILEDPRGSTSLQETSSKGCGKKAVSVFITIPSSHAISPLHLMLIKLQYPIGYHQVQPEKASGSSRRPLRVRCAPLPIERWIWGIPWCRWRKCGFHGWFDLSKRETHHPNFQTFWYFVQLELSNLHQKPDFSTWSTNCPKFFHHSIPIQQVAMAVSIFFHGLFGRKSFGSMTRIKTAPSVVRIWKRSWEPRLDMTDMTHMTQVSQKKPFLGQRVWILTQSYPRLAQDLLFHTAVEVLTCFLCVIELDDGKIYRKPLYLMVKTMVSCRFPLKPIHWMWSFLQYIERPRLMLPNRLWGPGWYPRPTHRRKP